MKLLQKKAFETRNRDGYMSKRVLQKLVSVYFNLYGSRLLAGLGEYMPVT